MRCIMHADDFGLFDDTFDETVRLLERGILTSATIMPGMAATERAIGFAKANPQWSFGVHLTYTRRDADERALAELDRVRHLTDAQGFFLDSSSLRLKALLNAIPHEELEAETRAQLSYFADRGLRISHVDSHAHFHKIGAFPKALAKVLPEFGITRVRAVQNIYDIYPPKVFTFWMSIFWGPALRKRFTTTDFFFAIRDRSICSWLGPDSPWMRRISRQCRNKTIEAGFHPGIREKWRQTDSKAAELFAQAAKANGAQLITWNDI